MLYTKELFTLEKVLKIRKKLYRNFLREMENYIRES